MEENYHVDVVSSNVDELHEENNLVDGDFWEGLDSSESSLETSITCSEIDDFLKFPQAKTDTNPLVWWSNNKFNLYLIVKLCYVILKLFLMLFKYGLKQV